MRSSDSISQNPSYGDLELLLTPNGPARLLRASGLQIERVSRNYIRLKPGSGALLGLTLTVKDQSGSLVVMPAYIRSHEAERAAMIAAKWHDRRSVPTLLGDGVQLLHGGRSVLFLFPNDARVRGMRFIADVDKLKRILSELPALQPWRVRATKTRLHVQRYKPERRLILRADLGLKDDRRGVRSERSMFLRFFVDDRGEQLANLIGELREQEVGSHIPEPLGSLQGGRMYVEQAVDGVEGLAQVEAGRADPAALAQALNKLHRAQVVGAGSINNLDVLAGAVEAGGSLALLAPELEPRINAVLDALRQHVPDDGPQAFLHGDFHLHQVLWTAEGPVLVDFERSVFGHPLYDLGQALAHLQIQGGDHCSEFAAGLRSEFERIRPEIDYAGLPFFVAHGILQRALLPARRLSEGWSSRCRELVELASEQIASKHQSVARSRFFDLTLSEDDVSWDRFYPSSGSRWPGRILANDGTLVYGNYDHDLKRFLPRSPQQDHELPGLASLLSRGDLLAYRPGRRAMVRCRVDGEVRYIKLVRTNRLTEVLGHHIAADAVGKAAGAPFPAFPAIIEGDHGIGALAISELQGESLYSILTGPSASADVRIDIVARSLAALHRAPIPIGDIPESSEGRSLQAWVDLVRRHDVGFANDCQAALLLIDELPRRTLRKTLVHGDLHDRNILLDEQRVALFDLDGFGLGDSLAEVGNLLSHFILRALQRGEGIRSAEPLFRRCLDVYRQQGGFAPLGLVEAAIARTLLRLACLYRFRRNQAHVCRPLLAEAEQMARIGCRA